MSDVKIGSAPGVLVQRITLGPNDLLLVELAEHLADHLGLICEQIDRATGMNKDRVLVYVKGDVRFSKVEKSRG
jgi:hypothetical protein